jgi:virulence-associated protein VapD
VFTAIGMAFLVGGIALITGPWWLPIASFFFGEIGVNIDAAVNYPLAVVLIAVGLSFLAFKLFALDRWDQRRALDKATIVHSPPSVQEVKRYLGDMLADHSYRSSYDTHFYLAYTQFADASKVLQDKKTAALFKAFSISAKDLHDFVIANFFVFPDNQGTDPDYRYCLAPNLNIDRGMASYDAKKVAQYDDLTRQLTEHVVKTQRSYDAFISHLKQLGHF